MLRRSFFIASALASAAALGCFFYPPAGETVAAAYSRLQTSLPAEEDINAFTSQAKDALQNAYAALHMQLRQEKARDWFDQLVTQARPHAKRYAQAVGMAWTNARSWFDQLIIQVRPHAERYAEAFVRSIAETANSVAGYAEHAWTRAEPHWTEFIRDEFNRRCCLGALSSLLVLCGLLVFRSRRRSGSRCSSTSNTLAAEAPKAYVAAAAPEPRAVPASQEPDPLRLFKEAFKDDPNSAASPHARIVKGAPTPLRRSRTDSPAPVAVPSKVSAESEFAEPGPETSARSQAEPSPAELAMLTIFNEGSLEDVLAIKGIGPKSAQAIVDYRDCHGHIASLDDLADAGLRSNVVCKLKQDC